MNHAEHDESIGSMLASIATALREVSDKLDIVAARVQLDVPTFPVEEDLPDHVRIRRLESWAFRASQDISRLSSRLDALDNDGEPDSGRPARGTRSRREVREAAEAAERAADGLTDQLSAPDPLPPHQNCGTDGSRPPLERRNSPARPATDHLGDPTALAATPVPRTVSAEASAVPPSRPATFDTDSIAAVGGNGAETAPPSRRSAPARLSNTGAGERVAVGSIGNATSTNGTAKGAAGDIAATRNGTPVPAVIGTVLTAPVVDHGPAASASTSTAAVLEEDRAPTSGLDSGAASSASVTLPGSAEVSAAVREGGVNGFGLSSAATRHVPSSPVDDRAARPATGDPLTTQIGPDAVIERARPVKKPAETSPLGDAGASVGPPEELSANGNGVARSAPTGQLHAADDQLSPGFTAERFTETPNGKPVNGFGPPSPIVDDIRTGTSTEAQPAVNTANGIHWSFTDDPAPTTPGRNGHARNGFTTDSARRAESLFDDFTPRDRLTAGETAERPAVSTPPARLTPPTELTTQPNQVSVDPARTPGSSHVNGFGDSAADPGPSSVDQPANAGRLPDHHARPDQASFTDHARPSSDFDPPTLGLPTGGDGSTSDPDPLVRPATDPIPPTATDAAGITVTGTFRAFDIESAQVDKLQAMLDELKRSAGLPPGRRDVFGPPTPDLG
ncbi:hypothetical protein [Nocardia alba]|uniref:Uncharacterized protein n=1 Tax=Nocardia alba TaxID=225051 RepID=A0A4R1FNL7_9NOCA|nr:hypothetical protein [Nocardia alba]TCJ94939.1 hypothetical protein DFR71_3848 [Nocardia alba]